MHTKIYSQQIAGKKLIYELENEVFIKKKQSHNGQGTKRVKKKKQQTVDLE